jgi:hypothetical protein
VLLSPMADLQVCAEDVQSKQEAADYQKRTHARLLPESPSANRAHRKCGWAIRTDSTIEPVCARS